MVKKLFKHEILSYFRLWIPTQIILLAVAFFIRVLLFFESDHYAFQLAFNSSGLVAYVTSLASIGITFVFGIIRFYKNLFTHEGYLTFTLPVTPRAHILVKLLTAVLFCVMSVVVLLFAGMIIASGDLLVEIFKAIGYLTKQAWAEIGFNFVLYIIEGLILLLVVLATQYLLYFACISIGQTFKKNRIFAAVGVYFVYYVISQILMTFLVIFSVAFARPLEVLFDHIGKFYDAHPALSVHIFLWVCVAVSALFGFLYYFITHFVIRKKLNLE